MVRFCYLTATLHRDWREFIIILCLFSVDENMPIRVTIRRQYVSLIMYLLYVSFFSFSFNKSINIKRIINMML